jgi:hypothetical protein
MELIADLVFVALTFVTALVPDNIIGPDSSLATTIVWIVWSWCSLMHVSSGEWPYPSSVHDS